MASSRTPVLAIVLGAVGVLLLVVAGALVQSDVTGEVEVDVGTSLTLECGSALDARGIPSGAFSSGREELRFTDEADAEVLRTQTLGDVEVVLGAADNACRDAGTSRVLVAAVPGVVGLAGIVAAVVVLIGRRGTAVAI